MPEDAPRLARFSYVMNSSPVELAANVARAMQDIVAEAGGLPCELGALVARDLCEALKRFLWLAPAAERVGAFWGVFPDMVAFLREVGEPPFEPPGIAGDLELDKVLDSPVGRLGCVLFSAHRRLSKEGGDFNAELLAGLELALDTYSNSGTGGSGADCRGAEVLAGLLGYESGYLFAVDGDWTREHVFARIGRGGAYRQDTARMLVCCGGWSSLEFMAGVQPFLFELCEDIEAVFGTEFGPRVSAVECLHLFADRAFEEHDEATSAQITDLLRGMPEMDRGNFIGMLRRRFDRALYSYFGPLPDRELFEILSDRLSTPQFIRTFWPAEPQSQTGYTAARFVGLLLNSGEHAEAIFEVCQDFLVPIEDKMWQNLVYSKLADNINYEDFVQANPAIVAGIIDRTTNEHSIHLKELTELKYHLTSETPPAAAP